MTASEWIEVMKFIAGLTAFLFGLYLRSPWAQGQLPKPVRDWVSRHVDLTELERVTLGIIEEAATMVTADPEYRRGYAVRQLREWFHGYTQVELPEFMANVIVEFFYSIWKRAVKK